MKGFRKLICSAKKQEFNLFAITSSIILCISRFQLSVEEKVNEKIIGLKSPGTCLGIFPETTIETKGNSTLLTKIRFS